MTWYVILIWTNRGWENATNDPLPYLNAKKKMQELKRENPGKKYRLIKTSY